MKINKTSEKIVCDVTGCGKLADCEIIADTGARVFICEECLKKLKRALKEFKISE